MISSRSVYSHIYLQTWNFNVLFDTFHFTAFALLTPFSKDNFSYSSNYRLKASFCPRNKKNHIKIKGLSHTVSAGNLLGAGAGQVAEGDEPRQVDEGTED